MVIHTAAGKVDENTWLRREPSAHPHNKKKGMRYFYLVTEDSNELECIQRADLFLQQRLCESYSHCVLDGRRGILLWPAPNADYFFRQHPSLYLEVAWEARPLTVLTLAQFLEPYHQRQAAFYPAAIETLEFAGPLTLYTEELLVDDCCLRQKPFASPEEALEWCDSIVS